MSLHLSGTAAEYLDPTKAGFDQHFNYYIPFKNGLKATPNAEALVTGYYTLRGSKDDLSEKQKIADDGTGLVLSVGIGIVNNGNIYISDFTPLPKNDDVKYYLPTLTCDIPHATASIVATTGYGKPTCQFTVVPDTGYHLTSVQLNNEDKSKFKITDNKKYVSGQWYQNTSPSSWTVHGTTEPDAVYYEPTINNTNENVTVTTKDENPNGAGKFEIIIKAKDGYNLTSVKASTTNDESKGQVIGFKDNQAGISLDKPTSKITVYLFIVTEKIKPKFSGSIRFNIDNATQTINDDNILTVTPNTGYLLDTVNAYTFVAGERLPLTVNMSKDKTNATIDLKDNLTDIINITGQTTVIPKQAKTKIVDISNISNITVSQETFNIGSVIQFTFTVNDGFKMVDDNPVSILTKNPINFSDDGTVLDTFNADDLTLNNGIYTLNYDTSKVPANNVIWLNVYTDKKPQPTQPTEPKYNFEVDNQVSNTTYTVDKNKITLTAKTGYNLDNGITINYTYQLYVGGEFGQQTIKPDTITNTTAIFTIDPDLADKESATAQINGDTHKENTPEPPTQTKQVSHLYEMQESDLLNFANLSVKYYQGGTNTDYDFTEFVNQIYRLPFKVDAKNYQETNQVLTGWFIVNMDVNRFISRNIILDLGYIKVDRPNNNGFDYNAESVTLHLPWTNPVKLDLNDVLGNNIHIIYNIRLETGTTNVIINNENGIISNFSINLANTIELFNIYNNKNFGSIKDVFANNIRQAYITINYFEPVKNLVSYETKEHGVLNNYKGYVKINNGLLTGSMTDSEYMDIMNKLYGGVYINDVKRN